MPAGPTERGARLARRRVLTLPLAAGVAAMTGHPAGAQPGSPPPAGAPGPLASAFLYTFPLYEMARTRWLSVEAPANPGRLPVNAVGHRRTLADHRSRVVTTPNNDTLYSSAWLDLAATAMRLSVPAIPGRYWSVALMDPFGNNFTMLGSRLDGAGPVDVLIVGPGWQGDAPAGLRLVRAPSNDVWLLGRWLVDGDDDLPAVHRIQDAVRLSPHGAPIATPVPQRERPTGSTDPASFVAVVNEFLGRNPPPQADRAMLEQWAALGIRPGVTDAFATLPADVQTAWRAAIGPLHLSLRDGLGHGRRVVAGWLYPPAAIGNFGADYALRASVALGGLAALEPAEAIYLGMDEGPDGRPLDGTRRYRLQVPAAGLDTDAFWSLSMYERLPDGRLFFVDNPIRRYAVGDRTRGLVRAGDGTLTLALQPDAPADAANWLPTPRGPFRLVLRAYQPRPSLLAGTAPLPSMTLA